MAAEPAFVDGAKLVEQDARLLAAEFHCRTAAERLSEAVAEQIVTRIGMFATRTAPR